LKKEFFTIFEKSHIPVFDKKLLQKQPAQTLKKEGLQKGVLPCLCKKTCQRRQQAREPQGISANHG